MSDRTVLSAPLVIEYPFSRTTGPVIGAFLTGLRERVLVGIRGSDGRVLVPPTEYDPLTGEDLTEMVEVGPAGRSPRGPGCRTDAEAPARQALRLGADPARRRRHRRCCTRSTPAPRPPWPPAYESVPQWADEREGAITDLACWVPGRGRMR